jgi:methionyl-tRNA formyltransferase
VRTIGKLSGITRKQDSATDTDTGDALKRIAETHEVPYFTLDNYHAPESIELLSSFKADLGVGFGTNILKESVFGIPRLGTINFHNGLVPYYRGGPPVFWELFNDENELGLTVHWMAAQVDAGDVILQETVPHVYDYSFGLDFERFIVEYRAKMSGTFAELMVKAVAAIAQNEASRIKQDATLGKRYRLPTKTEKDELRRRLKKRRPSANPGPIVK